jgi:hypothetical protein
MHADFSVELGRNDPALEIPWSSDDPSIRFFDLKKCPDLVRRIPEAAAHPEINAFLVRINAPGFPLATAKCDAWDSREISPEEEIFGADRKFVSYVDLFFVDDRNRCSFEKNEGLAKELCRLLSHAPDIAAAVELVVRRCYYHQQQAYHRHNEQTDETVCENPKTNKVFSFEPEVFGTAGKGRQSPDKGPDVLQGPRRAMFVPEQAPAHENQLFPDSSTSASGFYLTAYVSGFGDNEHEPRRRWAIAFVLLQHALVQLSCT